MIIPKKQLNIENIFDNNKNANFSYLYLLNPPDSFRKLMNFTTKNNKFIMLYADSNPSIVKK